MTSDDNDFVTIGEINGKTHVFHNNFLAEYKSTLTNNSVLSNVD